ncbi:MAG: hypothetical protein FWG53_01725, partial [Clostridiales bacterium]|nr:hypothetical protein [Clostridiales bacterium]
MKNKKSVITIVIAALLIATTAGCASAAAKVTLTAPIEAAMPQINAHFENMSGKLSTESTVKGVTLKIESVMKNDKVAWIDYSIQDEQNRLGEDIVSKFWIRGEDNPIADRAVRQEDGKLHGKLIAFSQNGFINSKIELLISQLRYNQLVGQTTKLNIDLSGLKAPRVQNIENQAYLKPDGYNYKLPINEGEGEAWLSNIGVVKGKLHVQIKTLSPSVHEGVIAADVQPGLANKNGDALYCEQNEEFYMGLDGKISFFSEASNSTDYPPKYHLSEYVYDLGPNKLADLELSFSSVPSSYLSGLWTVSFDPKIITKNIVKNPTSMQVGNLTLKSFAVTPLYIELNFKEGGNEQAVP